MILFILTQTCRYPLTLQTRIIHPIKSRRCTGILRPYPHVLCTRPEPVAYATFQLRTANVDDHARLDVKAVGFWGNHRQSAFFDVRVLDPFTRAYAYQTIPNHSVPYSETMKMIRCKLGFSLIDSANLCLRGAISAFHRPASCDLSDIPIDVIVSEGCL